MPAYFFDSSALVKCYVVETGSSWVRGVVAPASANDLHVLQISEVEAVSAIVRRRKSGSLGASDAAMALAQLRSEIQNDYILLRLSDRLIGHASALAEKHELRAYDALQLAGAVELSQVRIAAALPPLILVSADLELNSAARREGLVVEDPNLYP